MALQFSAFSLRIFDTRAPTPVHLAALIGSVHLASPIA
jgi:hypothetical protein